MMNEGIYLMGYVAFVMLVAAGFAAVMKSTGAIDSLVNSVTPIMMSSKVLATLLMLVIGLFITIGIGTSFGTIPGCVYFGTVHSMTDCNCSAR